MISPRKLFPVLFLLCGHVLARAEAPVRQAVYLDVCVSEQDVERVMEKVHTPVMEVLKTLPGTDSIGSAATHGRAQFQVQFKDGATRNDKTSVEEALKRVAFAIDVEVLSTHLELGQASDDGVFIGRLTCGYHLRRDQGR